MGGLNSGPREGGGQKLLCSCLGSDSRRRSQNPKIAGFVGRPDFDLIPTPAEEPDPSDLVTGLIDEAGSVDLGDSAIGGPNHLWCVVSFYSGPRRRRQI